MYTDYSNNYESSLNTHTQSLKTNKTYANIVEPILKDAEKEGGLELFALLIMPIQRIPRYQLLLQDLLRNTLESHPDYSKVQHALAQITSVAVHVNESIRQTENSQRVLSLPPHVRTLLEVLFFS